jgi:hypothetical protein
MLIRYTGTAQTKTSSGELKFQPPIYGTDIPHSRTDIHGLPLPTSCPQPIPSTQSMFQYQGDHRKSFTVHIPRIVVFFNH